VSHKELEEKEKNFDYYSSSSIIKTHENNDNGGSIVKTNKIKLNNNDNPWLMA